MAAPEYQPCEHMASAGYYEELNVFGTWTGRVALVKATDPCPDAPRGFTWRPLSTRSAAELRNRSKEYRRMADTAATAVVTAGLHRIADQLDLLADQSDQRTFEDDGTPV